MYYFQIVLLLVLVFLVLNDKKIKSLDELNIENSKIKKVRDNLIIINMNKRKIENIKKLETLKLEKIDKKYILLKNENITIDEKCLNIIIANFIDMDYKMCGFNINYKLNNKSVNVFKKLYVAGVNYLLLFQKHNILSYGIVLFKNTDSKNFKKIISFMAEDNMLNYTIDEVSIKNLRKIYIDSLKHMDFMMGLKTVLTLITGSIICTSLIYNFVNITYYNYMNFIISIILYYCYTYILNYIYKPIGRYKMLVSYIFPIYILIFVIISVINFIFKRIIRRKNA